MAGPPTSKLRTLLLWSLALIVSIYSNFQINASSGGTLSSPHHLFLKQNSDLEGFRVSHEAPLFGNRYNAHT